MHTPYDQIFVRNRAWVRETVARDPDYFTQLADKQQEPHFLFIGCSDSRVPATVITGTGPGEMFVHRNIANLVVPTDFNMLSVVQYAVDVLRVKDIIVCGHTHCGAMDGLLHPEKVAGLPSVAAWLEHAATTRRIVEDHYAHLPDDRKLVAAVEENVLVQLEHVRTIPAVASRLRRGDLHLHGWVYKIETGEVFAYDLETQEFSAISEHAVVTGAERRTRTALAGI